MFIFALLSLCASGAAAGAATDDDALARVGLANSAWTTVAAKHDLDPLLLYAIALGETRVRWTDGAIRPSPWSLRVAGVAHHPKSLAEAMDILHEAQQLGRVIQDVGLMQIYAPMHRQRVAKISDLLDPAVSLNVGADILVDALQSTPDVVLGIGRYHSWTESRARPYGKRVFGMWQALRRHCGLAPATSPWRNR